MNPNQVKAFIGSHPNLVKAPTPPRIDSIGRRIPENKRYNRKVRRWVAGHGGILEWLPAKGQRKHMRRKPKCMPMN
jgi:hypothetical protein